MRRFIFLLVLVAGAGIGSSPAGALDPECVAYMEADAIYEQTIAATQPEGWKDFLSETLFGPPNGIEEARNLAEFERLRAYWKAYKGPRSSVHSVMTELVMQDVFRCTMDWLIPGDSSDPLDLREHVE